MKRKYFIAGIIILAGFFIGYFIFTILQTLKNDLQTYQENPGYVKDTIPDDYLSVFKKEIIPVITDGKSFFYNQRNAVTAYSLYDNRYIVYHTKIQLTKELPLNQVIKESRGVIGPSTRIWYKSFEENLFEYQCRLSDISKVSMLCFLHENVDQNKTLVKNDSLLTYFVSDGKFALKYGKDSLVDIYTMPYKGIFFRNKIPMGVCFVRKGTFVHVLTISINTKAGSFNSENFNTLAQQLFD